MSDPVDPGAADLAACMESTKDQDCVTVLPAGGHWLVPAVSESILRKVLLNAWRSGWVDIDGGVIDVSMIDFTPDEVAYLKQLRDSVEAAETANTTPQRASDEHHP